MPDEVATSSRRGRLPSARVSAEIAEVELRRVVRRIRSQDLWLALMVVTGLIVLVSFPLIFSITSDWGQTLATGDTSPVSTFGLLLAVVWCFLTGFALVAGIGSYGEVDNAAGMLTIRPPKDVAFGLLLMNTLAYTPYLVPPMAVGYVGLSVGVGTPAPLVGGLLVLVVLYTSAMAIGYPLGLAVKGVVRRSALLSRFKSVFGVLVAVGYFWIMFGGHLTTIVDIARPALEGPPIGWLADVALLTTPDAGVSLTGAAGAFVVALVLVPLGTLATISAAKFAWYVDRSDENDETDVQAATESGEDQESETVSVPQVATLDRWLGLFARRQGTVGVATTTLVRAYRAPLQLVFVAAPLLFALPMVEVFVTAGTVPDYAPWFAMLYGGWAAAVAYPLNLLGNQGATLPLLLTAQADARQTVNGHLLAAAVTFAPVTAVLAAGAAVASGRSLTDASVMGGIAVVVVVSAAIVAAGLGALFPRFTSIDVTGDRTATPPSKAAVSLFSLLVVLAVTATGVLTDEVYRLLITGLLSDYLPLGIDPTASSLETAALALVSLFAVSVPLAYVVAVRRLRTYRIE